MKKVCVITGGGSGIGLASLSDERNGYLAGVDILCDGGATSGRKFRGMEYGGER